MVMTSLNPAIAGIPMPDGIAALRTDPVRGFPVPWFVSWIDGKPEFRVADARKLIEAVKKNLCWVCGRRMGQEFTFILGPMCVVNRVSAEPPLHLDCATYSAKACPFLSRPRMERREDGLPEGGACAGFMIVRNPGASALWTCTAFEKLRSNGGVLFRVTDPVKLSWWAEGRAATRDEVMRSVETGLPLLEAECDRETTPDRRASSRVQLGRMLAAARAYFPVA